MKPMEQMDYQALRFDQRRAPELDEVAPLIHPVVVVGAGPVGLSAAIDLAQQGISVVLVDNDDSLSVGSRALCFAKRTLEIFDRLGCGQRMVDKGVSWNIGKVYLQDELVYTFNLLPEPGHARPAFVNLQQYYVEGYLVERAAQLPNLDIRWKSEVVAGVQQPGHMALSIATPEGEYTLRAKYVIAADGARSAMRKTLGLDSHGRIFKDRFLIADVRMKAPFPAERQFWFDPPFHRNQSVLLHQQPDGIWRIDFQLGWDADPIAERDSARVTSRVQSLLGEDVEFDLEWVSVYTFACLRMDQFRHGRVLFAGDSAHGVSPFGARGANSGIQDADNLAWKLRLVLEGRAPETLLDTYAEEREFAADENILHSTRASDFITPKSTMSRVFRDETLKLAKRHPFARRLVNSGRLSVPSVLSTSPLNSPDQANDRFAGSMELGAVCTDAPIRAEGEDAWFLKYTAGTEFTGVYFCSTIEELTECAARSRRLMSWDIPAQMVVVVPPNLGIAPNRWPADLTIVEDASELLAQRFDARDGSFYLFRPDQHLCARWRAWSESSVEEALKRATCQR